MTANKQDTNDSLTLYEQLANQLRDDIDAGKYEPGEQLPTEFEFHDQTGLSRSTIRHALEILVGEGVLVKIHGKGTFVHKGGNNESDRSQFLSLTANAARLDAKMSTRLVDTRTVLADTSQQDFFNLPEGSELLELTRLRYVEGEPFCVETSLFTLDHQSLVDQDLNGSLYQLLKDKYAITPAGGHKTFDIAYANASESFLLGVDRGTALMQIIDFVYDSNQHPLHISRSVMRSDKYKYELAQ
jgi:GntR family transcriptional regulator